MRYRVIVQPPAWADLDEAYQYYLDSASRTVADRWLDRAETAIRSLSRLPERCRRAPESDEFDETIRQLLFGRRPHVYRVLFVVCGREVRVLHVRHGARRWMRRDEIQG